jgi:hypothetical protein
LAVSGEFTEANAAEIKLTHVPTFFPTLVATVVHFDGLPWLGSETQRHAVEYRSFASCCFDDQGRFRHLLELFLEIKSF